MVDLSALRHPPGVVAQQTCASLAVEVVLAVEDKGGTEEFRRDASAESGIVRFDGIEVEQGTVRFAVQVLSENQSLLYAGELSQEIQEPTFEAALELVAQAPVLQVCPADIFLGRGDESSTTVEVRNRGIGTLSYQAISPECEFGACLRLDPPTASVPEQSSGDLAATLVRILPAPSLELTIQSPEGSVPVVVTLVQLPDLVVSSFEATGPVIPAIEQFEMPGRLVIRNIGNVAAGAFALGSFYITTQGNTFTPAIRVEGQASPTVSALAPGEVVTLDVTVVFPLLEGATGDLQLWADSCTSDGPSPCAIDEFDEGNNFSPRMTVMMPIL